MKKELGAERASWNGQEPAWDQEEAAPTSYPGLEEMSDADLCFTAFQAAKDNRRVVLADWALAAMARFYEQGDIAFAQHVSFPAYDAGVHFGILLGAIKQWITDHETKGPLTPQSATVLLAKQFAPIRCFVDEILAEGLTILAGK